METPTYRRYHYILAPETSSDSDLSDKTDSVYSMQDKETEYVRDDSDTCTKSDDSEYTLNSLHTEDNLQLDSFSSDSSQFIIRTEHITVQLNEKMSSEREDTMSTSDDSELGQADYWNCAQCQKSNIHPKYRYCMKCFRLRKEMFPPKPKGTKKRGSDCSKSSGREVKASNKRKHSGSQRSSPDASSNLALLDTTLNLTALVRNRFKNKSFSSRCHELDSIQEAKRLKMGKDESPPLRNVNNMTCGSLTGNQSSTECSSTDASNLTLLDKTVNLAALVRNRFDDKSFSSRCLEIDSIQEAKRVNMGNDESPPVANVNSLTCGSLIGKFGTLQTSSQTFSDRCQAMDKVYEANLEMQSFADMCETMDKAHEENVKTTPEAKLPSVTSSDELQSPSDICDTSALCIMCVRAPKNGVFVHMKDAHSCCCYPCALKVWKTTKKCPTCNLSAFKVLRLYFS